MVDVLNRANVDEVTSIYGPVFCGTTPVIPKHYNDAATHTRRPSHGKDKPKISIRIPERDHPTDDRAQQ